MSTTRIPNTIIIASGKGGVGKTWFSISLAQALARLDKRILLFDGDLGLANVDIQLGLMPKRDLGKVLEGKCHFEDAIVAYPFHDKEKKEKKPKGKNQTGVMDIISGRSGSGAFSVISKSDIAQLRKAMQAIAPKYDHVILDLSAGLDQIVQEFSSFGSQCLVVVTDEPTSLTDGYAFIKVMGHHNPNLPIQVIVNMAESEQAGQNTFQTLAKACEKFLGKTLVLAGIIRRDNCVKDSIRNQTPTLTRHPNSQASTDIEKIAKAYTPVEPLLNHGED